MAPAQTLRRARRGSVSTFDGVMDWRTHVSIIECKRFAVGVGCLLTLLLAGAGCQGGEGGPAGAASAISAPARAEAQQIFSTRCFACHGADGRGDGPASTGLTPKPANFRDGSWQGAVDDQHIERIIQFGGAAVGKSPAMPSNPDLTSKPEVVAALREHIRGLAH
jgi:mono/diheme cytochrome c family protein